MWSSRTSWWSATRPRSPRAISKVAPDLIVEVLSPGTSAKDLRAKKALYERAGVREYLVIDPLEHYAIRFLLGADGYDKGTVFAWDEVLTFATLADVEVPLWEVFGLAGAGGARSCRGLTPGRSRLRRPWMYPAASGQAARLAEAP